MVRCEYPKLFAGDPWRSLAEEIAGKTLQFTEYLVDGLGHVRSRAAAARAAFVRPGRFLSWATAAGSRPCGAYPAGDVANASLYDLEEHDECCGFGGTFSVRLAAVSGSMLRRKLDNIERCPADTIVLGDLSCMAQINGGLSRRGSPKTTSGIADILADGLVRDRFYAG